MALDRFGRDCHSAAIYLIWTIIGLDGVYRSDDDARRYGGVSGIAADTSVFGRVFLAGRGMDYND